MRRYSVLFCLLLTTTLTAYEQQIKMIAAQLTEKLVVADRRTVAVVDFTDLQGNTTELGRFLAEELSVALSIDAKGFNVIDRTHLKAILQEHRLASSGVIEPQSARQLGKLAGVDTLVTGTVTPFGDSVRLSAKALDSASAALLAVSTAEIPKTNAITDLLARGIGGAQAQPPVRSRTSAPSAAVPTPDLTAQNGDFVFSVKECVRGGTRVTCTLTVTNTGSRAANLNICTVYV